MGDKLITIGKIAGTHGLKGDVKILLDDVDPKLLYKNLELEIIDHSQKLILSSINNAQKTIAHFEGIESIEDAQKLVGLKIGMLRSKFPKISDSEFFICDLIGVQCLDENDQKIGTVSNYYLSKVQTILTISPIHGESFDIPLVPQFILKIELPHFIKIKVPDFI